MTETELVLKARAEDGMSRALREISAEASKFGSSIREQAQTVDRLGTSARDLGIP